MERMMWPQEPRGVGPADIVRELETRSRVRRTPCGDGELVWRAWGEGPPLLLIHGGHGSWTHWIRNIAELAAERSVWAPDLPGLGDSSLPPGPEMADIVAPLSAGLRQLLGAELPVDVVAFSFGSVVSANLAARHPELVRRLVLVDAGGLGTPLGPIATQRVRGLGDDARRAALRSNLLTIMLHDPDSVDELALHLQASNIERARLNARPFIQPHKLLDVLPQVSAQIDAIWGELDGPHPCPDKQEAVLRSLHRGLEFRVLPGAGHWVMYERAAAFNRVLGELLRQPLRAP